MSNLILPRGVNPPSLSPRAPRGRPLTDPSRIRDARAGVPEPFWHELPGVPDSLLIATAIELGCDPVTAQECRSNPLARFSLAQLYCCVHNAECGDSSAAAVVDRARVAFANAPKVSEAMGAYEQTTSSEELQSLMGLD